MTSATFIFYGRRSRPLRSFNDLGLRSSSSPSTSDPSSSSSNSSGHRHRSRNSDPRRRNHRHNDDSDNSRPTRPPGNEPQQRGPPGEAPSRNIVNREATHGLNRRNGERDRLPGDVLLARERLLQRLRGVSVSEDRDSRETSASVHRDDFWLVDADRETSVSREQSNAISTELPSGAQHHHPASREPKKKPLGLSKETIHQLQHEVFQDSELGNSMSKASKECSICLETFVEGNQLIHLHCGHRFHTKCLYPWLHTCGECPYCRTSIVIT